MSVERHHGLGNLFVVHFYSLLYSSITLAVRNSTLSLVAMQVSPAMQVLSLFCSVEYFPFAFRPKLLSIENYLLDPVTSIIGVPPGIVLHDHMHHAA